MILFEKSELEWQQSISQNFAKQHFGLKRDKNLQFFHNFYLSSSYHNEYMYTSFMWCFDLCLMKNISGFLLTYGKEDN